MAGRKKMPPRAELKRMLAETGSAAETARQLGVPLQSVYNGNSDAREKRLLAVRPQNAFMPWPLMRPAHQRAEVATNLRTAHNLDSDNKVMPAIVRERITAWMELLECNDFVISYHPDTPPSRFSREGGFFVRPRRTGDSPGIMQMPNESEQPPTSDMIQSWDDLWLKSTG